VRIPRATIAIVAVTIAIARLRALGAALVLDRDAVIGGQLWRIVSGSFVHFSMTHLAWDLLVVAVTGVILERGGWPVGTIVAAAATAIGVAVLAFEPAIARYGGLSGIACTLTVIAALGAVGASGLTRWAGAALLVLLPAKLWWEWRTGAFLFVTGAGAAIRAVPLAHLAGAGVGAVIWGLRRAVAAHGPQLEVLEVEAEVGQR
jgi:rhomboid family GlyGly-CTERM serine protease